MQRRQRNKRKIRPQLGTQARPIFTTEQTPLGGQLVHDPIFPLAKTVSTGIYRVVLSSENPLTTPGLGSSASVPTFTSQAFALNLFPAYTGYTAIFDQYRIDLVEVTFIPRLDQVSTVGNYAGLLSTVIDYDDATNLTSVSEAMDYSSCLTVAGDKPFRRVVKPHVALAAYSGTVFTSFANQERQWLDAGSPGVVHYGVKTAWTATSVPYFYDVLWRAVFSFRSARG